MTDPARKPSLRESASKNGIGPYDFVRTIGRGTYANVKLAVHNTTKRQVRRAESVRPHASCSRCVKHSDSMERCQWRDPRKEGRRAH